MSTGDLYAWLVGWIDQFFALPLFTFVSYVASACANIPPDQTAQEIAYPIDQVLGFLLFVPEIMPLNTTIVIVIPLLVTLIMVGVKLFKYIWSLIPFKAS